MGTDDRSRPHRVGTRLVFLLLVASSVLAPRRLGSHGRPSGLLSASRASHGARAARTGVLAPVPVGFAKHRASVTGSGTVLAPARRRSR